MSRLPDYARYTYPGVATWGAPYGMVPKEYHRYTTQGLAFGNPALNAGNQGWRLVEDYEFNAAASINDGDYLTINVSCRQPIGNPGTTPQLATATFEFDKVPDGVTPGNIAVDISAAVSAEDVRDATLAVLVASAMHCPAARFVASGTDSIRVICQPSTLVIVAEGGTGDPLASTNTRENHYNDLAVQGLGAGPAILPFEVSSGAGGMPIVPHRGRSAYRGPA